MKAKITTTTHDSAIAYDIAEEMTELTGHNFSIIEIHRSANDMYYIIKGEITSEQFDDMRDIENDWVFIEPTNEWVAKYGKKIGEGYSRTEHSLAFLYVIYNFQAERYMVLVSDGKNGYEVEYPEEVAKKTS